MTAVLTFARRELLELTRNRMVIVSMVIMTGAFAWMSSTNVSEWQLLSLAAMIGIYGSYAISGQAFSGEKFSGCMETVLCGPVTTRDIWFGKILGTLLPSAALSYLSLGMSLAISNSRGQTVALDLQFVVFVAVMVPMVIIASTGILGLIQLSLNARYVRVLSIGVIALVFSLLGIAISVPQQGGLISWQSLALLGALMLGLLAIPMVLVNRLSKERIVLTSEV